MLSDMNHRRHAALAASVCAAISIMCSRDALARSGGMTGVSVSGCGGAGCHGPSSISTSVRIEGPTAVVRGSMNTYTLVITNMGFLQDSAGLDISATSGTLGTAAEATQTQLRSGEVTHSARIAGTPSGEWRIAFRWSAPAAAGAATINAAANATNSNFSAGGDQWNTGSLMITVTDTMMAMDSGAPDGATPRDAALPLDGATTPDASTARDGATMAGDSSATADGATGAPMPMSQGCTTSAPAHTPRAAWIALGVVASLFSRRRRATTA
jgi:MYXO-CTERM domain-containing protein